MIKYIEICPECGQHSVTAFENEDGTVIFYCSECGYVQEKTFERKEE